MNKDRAKGTIDEMVGTAKQKAGSLTGNTKDHVSYCTPLVRCEDTLVCSTSSYTPSAFFG